MNPLLRKLLSRYQAPADDGSDLGGDVLDIEDDDTEGADSSVSDEPEDRGDVFEPKKKAAAREEEPEEVPEPQAQDEDDSQHGKPAGIPKSRFNEVNDQRKAAEQRAEAAERELAALRAQQQSSAPQAPATDAAPAFDEDAKEEAYVEALMNGDSKAAAAIRREINNHVRQEAATQARQIAQSDYEQRTLANALRAESDLAIQSYPYLDTPDGSEALELILALRDAGIAKGEEAHIALRKAVAKIAPRFAPPDADTPSRVLPNGTAKTDSRPAAALARGAADSTAQPPAVQAGIGNRANAARIDVENLTDEQFSALTNEEKKRLRGD